MSVTIRTRSAGRDPVARSHRRAAVARTVLIVLMVVVIVGGGVWLLFASSVFAVTSVIVEGASDGVSQRLTAAVDEVLGQRALGFLRPARNIMFMDEQAVADSLLASFSDVGQLTVRKEFPHTLRITATERTPIGTWCREGTCQYFDGSGARWGTAVQSRGPLLLLVQDERTDTSGDARMFRGMMEATEAMPAAGLRPIVITLPDAAPGDMRITVSAGYDIVADALGDVDDQMSTLAVLLADRASDPAFRPQYIDIRTPGRAYYR